MRAAPLRLPGILLGAGSRYYAELVASDLKRTVPITLYLLRLSLSLRAVLAYAYVPPFYLPFSR